MIKNLLIFSTFLFSSFSFSQTVKCEDLIDYVKKEGSRKSSISPINLVQSSWLSDVKSYKVEGKTVVIATIKKDTYGIRTQDYIFCGVPDTNWSRFSNGIFDTGLSIGERFHKYIMDYQCNCN